MIKPSMWAVQQAQVAKPWQWAWDGLVGAWLFDLGDKSTIYDKLKQNDADLTIGTGAWSSSGEGRILHLNGDGGVDTGTAELPGGVSLLAASTERWTVAARCRVGVGNVGYVVAKRTSTLLSATFSLYFNPDNAPRFILRGSTTDTAWGLDDGTFHTLWVTWDGATAKGYYDDAQGDLTLNVGAGSTPENISFGARTPSAWPGYPLTGDLSFVNVWDYAVPPAVIREFNRDPFGPFRRGRQLILKSDGRRQTRFAAQ